jgi:lysozyme
MGAGAMNVSPIGRAWTAHSEGCRLTAYPDNGACSIGYGHRGVPEGTIWTQEQAEAALDADLGHACGVIADAVMVDLTQGQIDALADFIFNEGEGRFKGSTLLRVLNFGEYARVPDELRRWKYAAGVVNQGLQARREGEVVLWNGGNPLEV